MSHAGDDARVDAGDRPRCSVLWPPGTTRPPAPDQPPAYFADLFLDQVVTAVLRSRDEHDLASDFRIRLEEQEAIDHRQAVAMDLERPDVREPVDRFVAAMARMRRYLGLAERLRYAAEQHIWFLHGTRTYSDAVAQLADELGAVDLEAEGLRAVRGHLAELVRSRDHAALVDDAERVLSELQQVECCLHLGDLSVTVAHCEDEPGEDYSRRIAGLFARFRQHPSSAEPRDVSDDPGLDHIEGGIVERVTRLFPAVFAELERFVDAHADFTDPAVVAFDREVAYYLAYLDVIDPLRASGLPFCYPQVSSDGALEVDETFDLALALDPPAGGVVTNDVNLDPDEHIVVITGANQGGKTTFARTVGQLHHLAGLGLPVPGRRGRVPTCDAILTHFARREQLDDLRGRLQDDLLRLRDHLEHATSGSVLILNETFGSTTLADARELGGRILDRIAARGARCIYVTFVDELAGRDDAVSFVATVDPDDPSVRTYRVVRRPADGRAYALAIARKYGLTRDALLERIPG